MNWVNLEVRTLRSPEYIGSSPTERATWLNVLAYCCEQENGGCIEGASEWKDRQWQQVCGVTLREVKSANKLLKWESGRLVVVFYPVAKEIEVQAKREAGRAGGIQKAKQFASTATSSASSTPDNSASTERKGKEGEGEREGKENHHPAADGAPLVVVAKASVRPSREDAIAYGAEIGMSKPDVDAWFDHFEANGWKVGGKAPMKDWRAALRNGNRRKAEFAPAGTKRVEVKL